MAGGCYMHWKFCVFVYILGHAGAIVGKWAQIAGKSRSFRCGNAFAALYTGQSHQDGH